MKRFDKINLYHTPIRSSIGCLLLLLFPLLACADNITHTYDSLNRLTRTDYGNGNVINYTYDAAGNRTSQTVAVPNPLPPANQPPVANAGSC